MTPREYDIEASAATKRWQDDSDRDLVQAYLGVAFYTQAMAGKLPDLKTLLARNRRGPHRQTPAEQRAVLQQLSAQYGIPLREVVH